MPKQSQSEYEKLVQIQALAASEIINKELAGQTDNDDWQEIYRSSTKALRK